MPAIPDDTGPGRTLVPGGGYSGEHADETYLAVNMGTIGVGLPTDDTIPHAPGTPMSEVDDGMLSRGATIGRLMILRALGAGGMGVVYAAYDPELDRNVALKLIHPSQARSGEARTRLQREAQALARLNHPNVVTVHDVGVHGRQVWLSMELVEGAVVGEWVRATKPDWQTILEIFLQAAQGVAAAHAAGLLHRDLKPDNIMVGDDGRVRVMDFGLARAGRERGSPTREVTPTLDSLSLEMTAAGAVMGTPAYMAPEQWRGNAADERTDQFALCASLWEALYGQRAHQGKTFEALANAVCSGAITAPPMSASVPGWLRRTLSRGLAVARDDRYRDVEALMAALSADPTRRRWLLGAALTVGVAGAVWASAQYLEEQRALAECRRLADRVDDVWSPDARATLRAGLTNSGLAFAPATADKVMPWLDDYAEQWRAARFDACTAKSINGTWDKTLAEPASRCLDERRQFLGSLVESLSSPGDGELGEAVVRGAVMAAATLPPLEPCRDVMALRRAPALPEDLTLRGEIERVQTALTRAQALESAGRYRDALQVASAAQAEADTLGWAPLRARASHWRATLHMRLGEYELAEQLFEATHLLAGRAGEEILYADAAVSLIGLVGDYNARPREGLRWGAIAEMLFDRAGVPPDDLKRAPLLYSLGTVYDQQGDYARARELLARSLELRVAGLGPEHPGIAGSLDSLGSAQNHLGDYKAALETHERAFALREATLGAEHPELITSLINLAVDAHSLGDFSGSVEYARRALALGERSLGPTHVVLADILNNLATTEHRRGNSEIATGLLERSLKIREATMGREHPTLVGTLSNLGLFHLARGDTEQALSSLERAMEIAKRTVGERHMRTAAVLSALSSVYSRRDELERALEYQERSRSIWEEALGAEHPKLRTAHNNTALIHERMGSLELALDHHRRALAIAEKVHGSEHPVVAFSLSGIGIILTKQGRHGEALPLLERALKIREGGEVPATHLAYTRFALARALSADAESRGRARALARDAQETYATAGPGFAQELGEVNRWLAEHTSEEGA